MPRLDRQLALVAFVMIGTSACGGDDETKPSPGGGGGGSGGMAIPTEPPVTGPQPWDCEVGELRLDDGTCLPAGIPDGACGEGFASDGDAGCVAILPDDPCGPGTMAIPGETSCREVAPCGSGPWGTIPVDGTTQHVDASYTGGDGDGTASKPWPTIQEGIDAAASGAIVAVAAGSYTENLVIDDKAVRLWGKCPAEVEIVGETANGAVVFVHNAAASATELRDLALTGGSTGVLVDGASDVQLDRLWIHDLTWIGFYAYYGSGPSSVTMSRSLVEGAVAHAIYVVGSSLALSESVVRDTAADVNGDDGAALYATADLDEHTPSSVEVTRSILERQYDYGARIMGSTASFEDSLIRETAPQPSSSDGGQGLRVQDQMDVEYPGAVELRGVVLADNHECGLCIINADGDLDRVVVRDVTPPPADNYAAPILLGIDGKLEGVRPSHRVRSTLVERGNYIGLGVISSDAVIEGLVVRDMAADALMGMGRGVSLESEPTHAQHAVVTLRGAVVERVIGYGIASIGAETDMESVRVQDVAAETVSQIYGRGIGFEQEQFGGMPSVGTLRHALVERATEFGVSSIGSDADIDSLVVRDTQPRPLDGFLGRGLVVQVSLETMWRSNATVSHSAVEGSFEAGIMVISSDVVIRNTLVRNTVAQRDTGLFGDGIVTYGATDLQWLLHPASAALTDVHVATSQRAGVTSWAADVSMGGVWLDCNTVDINGEMIQYYHFSFTNTGGNRCGCGDESWDCQVLSSNLEPPPIE